MKKLIYSATALLMLAGTTVFSACNDDDDNDNRVSVSGITIDEPGDITVAAKSSVILAYTVTPDDAYGKIVYWSSSDTSIATVIKGTVTGVKEGTATITARTKDGNYTASCQVTVTPYILKATAITPTKSTVELAIEGTYQIEYSILPAGSTDTTVSYSSSDVNVATVDAKGLVTAVADGTATITLTAGNVTGTVSVTVSKALKTLDIDVLGSTVKVPSFSIVGNGEFIDDSYFGTAYKNLTDGAAIRTNYLSLPATAITGCADAKILTISFWIKNYNSATLSEWSPVFIAKNGTPASEWQYFIFRQKGQLLVNYAGYVDSPENTNISSWLSGNANWHYVVATVSDTDLTLYIDGAVASTIVTDGTDAKNTSGFISNLSNINLFALGGMQTNGWGDPDVPCIYAGVKVTNTTPVATDVKSTYDTVLPQLSK